MGKILQLNSTSNILQKEQTPKLKLILIDGGNYVGTVLSFEAFKSGHLKSSDNLVYVDFNERVKK